MIETIFQKSQKEQRAYTLPKDSSKWTRYFPEDSLLRQSPLELPELSEMDLTRHFIGLSRRNVGIDNIFYPLGSCTMKLNPRINEIVAQLFDFSNTHPLASDDLVQGNLEVIFELLQFLINLTGMTAGSLLPCAGAQGELTGVKMIAAYHAARNDHKRKEFLIPDSAHGTNPATVAMAGFSARSIRTNPEGDIDLNHLKEAVSESTAGLMLTNPNTLGLFSSHIQEITKIVHANGGLLYYDGANLNPILTIVKPGVMGFDVMHMNLHKTFSTPHGGGGPGSGPVLCNDKLKPFLPIPRVEKVQGRFITCTQDDQSIGKITSFHGNFAIYLRAYMYAKLHGFFGLRRIAENSVLNANYLKEKISKFLTVPFPQRCMHEFVVQATRFLPQNIRALDIAKRLLDYGVHAPTIYFPLIVKECFLIEPTETESKKTLDSFLDALEKITIEAKKDPELLRSAPHTTPVARLNETLAAKYPVLIDPVVSKVKTNYPSPPPKETVNSLNDYLEKLESVTVELVEARLLSEQANQAKNAFLANMSHELRTPLNGIIGNVTLMMHTELSDHQEKYLKRIQSASQILLEIIGQVLDFSKIAAGELKLESIPCDLKKTVLECHDILIAKAEEKHLELLFHLPIESIPLVLSDPTRLKQILINLIGNAIKFTAKGAVNLSLEASSQNQNHLSLKITIKDTGIGIPKDKMEHLFEKFWQADSSNTRKYGGTGLGLAITKELIEQMGGNIVVESIEGEGTTFTLYIPFLIAKHEKVML